MQVSNWFINARVRLWKPMVEEIYLEETKDQDSNQSPQGTAEHEGNDTNSRPNHLQRQLSQSSQNPNPSAAHLQVVQKPLPAHHNMDSAALTSIWDNGNRGVSTPDGNRMHHQQTLRSENFGAVDIDFASYNECNSSQNFRNGSVSLTLGLQHHTGEGISLSFSPSSQQSMFYSREQMDEYQPVQFSILDGQEQNVPLYRNLMGSQTLHDLAG